MDWLGNHTLKNMHPAIYYTINKTTVQPEDFTAFIFIVPLFSLSEMYYIILDNWLSPKRKTTKGHTPRPNKGQKPMYQGVRYSESPLHILGLASFERSSCFLTAILFNSKTYSIPSNLFSINTFSHKQCS